MGCETFIRYGSKEEAIASSEANALLPKELNGKTTCSAKWISEQGKARNYKALGKGHDYKMTIVTKPGAKKWLADHSKPTDFNCNESDYMKFVMIKRNEEGSYGIGVDLLSEFNKKFSPKITYKKIK